MANSQHIVVAGAGAVGCFVGGLLSAGGHRVTLLARPRITTEIRAHGLTVTDFGGLAVRIDPDAMSLTQDPACLSGADIVLVTVKSRDTAAIAQDIARHGRAMAPVVSLQNGIGNDEVLLAALPGWDVRAGIVPFNVVPMAEGCFHRASSGDIVIGTGYGTLARVLSVPHLALTESADIRAEQWGKLLLNLNNALNALSGLTLHEQLHSRDWRRLLADQWAEALGVLRASGIKPAGATSVPVGLIPMILRLPTPLFQRIAASMLTIDRQARTSMAHDLMANRRTEIDAFQGLVARMGRQLGRATPISDMVIDVIRCAENACDGLPDLHPKALRRAIGQPGGATAP